MSVSGKKKSTFFGKGKPLFGRQQADYREAKASAIGIMNKNR